MQARKRPLRLVDMVLTFIGSAVCGVGLALFTVPNKIATGGLGGIATVLYHGMGVPVGLVFLGGNAILMAIQFRLVGLRTVWQTFLSVVTVSVTIEVLMHWWQVPAPTTNTLLASIYGGLLTGTGVGIVFRAGGTTGGLDIVAQLLYRFYRLPLGDTMFVANIFVMVLAGAFFGPELALLGLVSIYVSLQMIETILEGLSMQRLAFIVSKESDVIGQAIIEEMQRGVTALEAMGGYTATKGEVLMVALRRREVPLLRRLVLEYDPKAFMVISDARQVLGKGFVDLKEEVTRDAP